MQRNTLMRTKADFFKQPHKKVNCAILSAMPEEQNHFHKIFASCKYEMARVGNFEFNIYEYNNNRILLSPTGLGTTFTASAVTLIHQHFNPDFILFSGTAGGMKAEIKLRDVIIIERAFEAEIQDVFTILKGTPFESCLKHPFNNLPFPPIYSANAKLLNIATDINYTDATVHTGTAVSSNLFPAPKELFEKIKNQNPFSIDMETSALYQIAWLLQIPVLAIRGVSNILNADGTDDKIPESDVKGSAEAAAKVVLRILNKILLKNNYPQELDAETNKEIKTIIENFKLEAHPEGGYFNRTFKSTDEVKSTDPRRYKDETRKAGSSIYYLLAGNDFSAWHSLTSDEIWHFYKGSPVKIHVIDKQGTLATLLLGDPTKISGAAFQVVIKAGDWFAAENLDQSSYSLVGCTVSPGFEFNDFKLADRTNLVELFPHHTLIIERLTRGASLVADEPYKADHRFSL